VKTKQQWITLIDAKNDLLVAHYIEAGIQYLDPVKGPASAPFLWGLTSKLYNWLYMLCFPYFMTFVSSNDAYKGGLFETRLFSPTAFCLESCGELIGQVFGFIPMFHYKVSITRNLVVPILTAGCFGIFYKSFTPKLAPIFIGCNDTNSTNTSIPTSNASESDNSYYNCTDSKINNALNVVAPTEPGNGIPDQLYLTTTFFFGWLSGFWAVMTPVEEPKYDWTSEAQDNFKRIYDNFGKMGASFGAISSILLEKLR
jgi:hypothetical protein